MRQFLTLLILLFLSGCIEKKPENIQSKLEPESEPNIVESEKKQDTIHNYWELNRDTIYDKKEFKNSGLRYTLEIKTFSLNDSSIVRNLGHSGSQIFLDHSHKIASEFKLLTGSNIDTKRIDRTVFKESLIPEFYAACNL